jgi:hypothetical protein
VQYTLSESGPSGYTASAWVCVGGTQSGTDKITLAAGDDVTCTITNDDDEPVPSNGRILPTATTCQDYASGNATDLTTLLATIRGNKIGTISPGVFFYYATVTKAAGEGVGFTQSVTSPISGFPKYIVQQDQAFLFTSSCTKVATLTLSDGGTAGSDGSSLPAGTYILGIKFTPANAKGTSVPSNLQDSGDLLATHFYQATVNGAGQATTNASVNTNVK